MSHRPEALCRLDQEYLNIPQVPATKLERLAVNVAKKTPENPVTLDMMKFSGQCYKLRRHSSVQLSRLYLHSQYSQGSNHYGFMVKYGEAAWISSFNFLLLLSVEVRNTDAAAPPPPPPFSFFSFPFSFPSFHLSGVLGCRVADLNIHSDYVGTPYFVSHGVIQKSSQLLSLTMKQYQAQKP